jgi:hypothetical protein
MSFKSATNEWSAKERQRVWWLFYGHHRLVYAAAACRVQLNSLEESRRSEPGIGVKLLAEFRLRSLTLAAADKGRNVVRSIECRSDTISLFEGTSAHKLISIRISSPGVQEPTCSQAFYRFRSWVKNAKEIIRNFYPAASLELVAPGSMVLFIDFPGTAITDLPVTLEGFPVPEQHGYVDAVNEEGVVHVTLLGSSSSSTADTDQATAETVLLDTARPDVKQYLSRVKQRAPQCSARTVNGPQCRNHTLKRLPDGRPRCYRHMSIDIEDYMEMTKESG